MLLEQTKRPRREENLVPLINIVFLMLIFFLIAATLKPFDKRDIEIAETSTLESGKMPRNVILISTDGDVFINDYLVPEDKLELALRPWVLRTTLEKPMMIIADRALEADKLITVLEAANKAGVKHIKLVTQLKRGS